jgi:hypothetical protein
MTCNNTILYMMVCLRLEAMMLRVVLAAILTAALGASGHAQPCNPVIDGTYCATLPKNQPGQAMPPRKNTKLDLDYAPQIQEGLGADLTPGGDQPATFGAISFRNDGTRCIGLVRRGSCK